MLYIGEIGRCLRERFGELFFTCSSKLCSVMMFSHSEYSMQISSTQILLPKLQILPPPPPPKSSTHYLMSGTGLSINIIRFKFPSFSLDLKLHTSFPQSFRHACSDPIPDVNLTSEDGTTINSFTFSAAIMTSSTFGTKTCTTLKIRSACALHIFANSLA